MYEKNDSSLFFTCSLIEKLGRTLHLERGKVASALGEKGLGIIYSHADVFHCEPVEKVADDIINEFDLSSGDYDNV